MSFDCLQEVNTLYVHAYQALATQWPHESKMKNENENEKAVVNYSPQAVVDYISV